jgi:hypothetical protein
MTGKSFFTVEIAPDTAISSRKDGRLAGMQGASKGGLVRDLGRAKWSMAIVGFACLGAATQLGCNGCGGGTLSGAGGAGVIHMGVAGAVGSAGVAGGPGSAGNVGGEVGVGGWTFDCSVPSADGGVSSDDGGSAATSQPALGLLAPLSYPSATPFNVVLGDVTGDGNADVVIVDARVSVQVNDGTGRLGAPVDRGPATPLGEAPYTALVGDLNGDGYDDLVYGHSPQYPTSYIAVRLADRAGGFAPPVDYRITGLGYPYLALADLDGDGDQDIAAVVSDAGDPSEIDALINAGDGTFTPTVKYRNAGEAYGVAAADLDGDGRDDLVVGTYSDDSVHVFWNRGNGDLLAPVKVPAGVHPLTVSIGDLDGDGHPELVVVNQLDASDASITGGMPSTVSVLHNRAQGSFDPPVAWEVGVGASWSALSDLNGDGTPDVTVVNGTMDATLLFNNGSGAFFTPLRIGVGGEPVDLRAGEMNGDGRPDLLFINNTGELVVVLTTASDLPAAPINYPTGRVPNPPVPTPTAPAAIASGDLDGDGKIDLVVTSTLPDDEGMKVLLNEGSGLFGGPVPFNVPVASAPRPGTLAMADLNRDRIADIVSGSDYPCVYMASRTGAVAPGRCYMNGADGNPMTLALGDVDGDGLPDLAVVRSTGTQILTNDGSGTFFESAQLGGISAWRVSATLADVNRDGHAELLIASAANAGTTGSVDLFYNDGSGNFLTEAFLSAGSSPSAVAVADLNGDGWPDIAVANLLNPTCSGDQGTLDILFADGNGGFRGSVRR